MKQDVVVIGGGAAGLHVAKALSLRGLGVALVHKGAPGGELANLEWVEDFPEPGARTGGAELASRFIEEAQSAGVHFVEGEVTELESYSRSVAAILADQRAITAACVVVATGRRKRKLEEADLDRFEGRGLIGCAACEAAFYRDASVVVCGSGQAGALDALYLSRFAREVTVIERASAPGWSAPLRDRLDAAGNVRLLLNTRLEGASGPEAMDTVELRDAHGQTRALPATGVAIQVGHQPETEFLADTVVLDDVGHVLTERARQTSIPRILAIGDVRSGAQRTVLGAIEDGRIACEAICALLLPQPAG